ncbi:MAG: hypothetical protein KGD65_13420 [Candidatus Lokiarchaeota archaeon]|nr:hypothetical protein [Candidatus Lokiarchaeota archaeon]
MTLGCLEKYEEEIECYNKALEIDPENLTHHNRHLHI